MAHWRTVFRYDVINRVTKAGFWIGGFVLPILGLLVVLGMGYIQERAAQEPAAPQEPAATQHLIGIVDEAGLLQSIPQDLPGLERLRFYPDQTTARADLEKGDLYTLYIIPPDYLESGKLTAIMQKAGFAALMDETTVNPIVAYLLRLNLLGGDAARLALLQQPMRLNVEAIAPSSYDEDNPATFFVPYGVTLLYYFFVMMSASMLLNTIAIEKQNRVLEIMLTCLRPLDLLTGKMLALAVLSLLQLLVWAGSGLLILRLGGKTLDLPPGMVIPDTVLLWGALFFLLGYTLYASLMAGIGALVSDLREASQVTFLVISPLLVPLFFINILIEDPHGPFGTVLSLFPFTAPVVMMTRLTTGNVPWWQLALAIIGLMLFAWLALRATANLFRAQLMLTGQPLTIKRYLLALIGRNV